jgi:hypothetical protein
MTYDPNADPVMRAGLQAMGACILQEVGPGVAFAVFIDWRDGRPPSYLSNAQRRSVTAALTEWLARTAPAPGAEPARRAGAPTPLQARAAALVQSMDEEDVGAAIFLFGGEPGADGTAGETAWAASVPDVRARVERWVAVERRRS